MKDNIYKYPCTECPNQDKCYIFCKPYKLWFKEEWAIVTAPFRNLAFERDMRKQKGEVHGEVKYTS